MSFNYQGAPIYNPGSPDALGLSTWSLFGNALLATALFRCWHILIFFGAWSTAVCVIIYNGHHLALQPTLITVYVSPLILGDARVIYSSCLDLVLSLVLSFPTGLLPVLNVTMRDEGFGHRLCLEAVPSLAPCGYTYQVHIGLVAIFDDG